MREQIILLGTDLSDANWSIPAVVAPDLEYTSSLLDQGVASLIVVGSKIPENQLLGLLISCHERAIDQRPSLLLSVPRLSALVSESLLSYAAPFFVSSYDLSEKEAFSLLPPLLRLRERAQSVASRNPDLLFSDEEEEVDLLNLCSRLLLQRDLESAARILIRGCCELLDAMAHFTAIDVQTGVACITVAQPPVASLQTPLCGLVGICALTCSALVVDDVTSDRRADARLDTPFGWGGERVLLHPIVVLGETIGVVTLTRAEHAPCFSLRDRNLLAQVVTSSTTIFTTLHLEEKGNSQLLGGALSSMFLKDAVDAYTSRQDYLYKASVGKTTTLNSFHYTWLVLLLMAIVSLPLFQVRQHFSTPLVIRVISVSPKGDQRFGIFAPVPQVVFSQIDQRRSVKIHLGNRYYETYDAFLTHQLATTNDRSYEYPSQRSQSLIYVQLLTYFCSPQDKGSVEMPCATDSVGSAKFALSPVRLWTLIAERFRHAHEIQGLH